MEKNQRLEVLKCLQNGGELTVISAVTQLGVLSLPRRIMELRNMGYPIVTEYRRSETGKLYGVYKLQEAK